MKVSVSFRHMPTSEALKTHTEEKLSKLDRYFFDLTDAHVALGLERHQHEAEITLHAHGMVIHGKEISTDMYNSIDRAIEKIERQLRRYHNKMATLKPRQGAKIKLKYQILEAQDNQEEAPTHFLPQIIEAKELETRPMMLDEAVMQMDLLHDDLLVFINAKTDQINVLYRKKGNQYGLIETHPVHAH